MADDDAIFVAYLVILPGYHAAVRCALVDLTSAHRPVESKKRFRMLLSASLPVLLLTVMLLVLLAARRSE